MTGRRKSASTVVQRSDNNERVNQNAPKKMLVMMVWLELLRRRSVTRSAPPFELQCATVVESKEMQRGNATDDIIQVDIEFKAGIQTFQIFERKSSFPERVSLPSGGGH